MFRKGGTSEVKTYLIDDKGLQVWQVDTDDYNGGEYKIIAASAEDAIAVYRQLNGKDEVVSVRKYGNVNMYKIEVPERLLRSEVFSDVRH